MLETVYH